MVIELKIFRASERKRADHLATERDKLAAELADARRESVALRAAGDKMLAAILAASDCDVNHHAGCDCCAALGAWHAATRGGQQAAEVAGP